MCNRFSRNVETEDAKPSIFIICEGEKTEPNYFLGFRLSNVKVEGKGYNIVSLIEYAEQFKYEYDEIWCVFDQDGHIDKFDSAISKCRENVHAAYTNEAFELWYLLHFDDIQPDMGMTRDQYCEKLDAYIPQKRGRNRPKYCKNDREIYNKLLEHQSTAIRRAKRILDDYPEYYNPSQKKPVTTVHLLVERLNEFL